MLFTSQNIISIFMICFDIKLANTTQERSTRGLGQMLITSQNITLKKLSFQANLNMIKVLSCHIYSFLKAFAYNFALKTEKWVWNWNKTKKYWKCVFFLCVLKFKKAFWRHFKIIKTVFKIFKKHFEKIGVCPSLCIIRLIIERWPGYRIKGLQFAQLCTFNKIGVTAKICFKIF